MNLNLSLLYFTPSSKICRYSLSTQWEKSLSLFFYSAFCLTLSSEHVRLYVHTIQNAITNVVTQCVNTIHYPIHSTTNSHGYIVTIAVQDAVWDVHPNIAIILSLARQEIATRVDAILDTIIMETSCTTICIGDVQYHALITGIMMIICMRIERQENACHSVPLTILEIDNHRYV